MTIFREDTDQLEAEYRSRRRQRPPEAEFPVLPRPKLVAWLTFSTVLLVALRKR